MNENETLMEVNRALGRLEGKLDALLQQSASDRSDTDKLRARVSKLENWRTYLMGAWAATILIVGFVVRLVIK